MIAVLLGFSFRGFAGRGASGRGWLDGGCGGCQDCDALLSDAADFPFWFARLSPRSCRESLQHQ